MTTKTSKDVTPLATAIVKFYPDGRVTARLTSCDGITARKLDGISQLLWRELVALRAKERQKRSTLVESTRA